MKLGSLSHFRQDSSRSHPARRNTVELDHARRIQIVAQLTSIAAVMALWPHVDNPLQLAAWWMGLTITLTVLQHLTRSLLVQHDDIALQNYISSAGTLAGGAAFCYFLGNAKSKRILLASCATKSPFGHKKRPDGRQVFFLWYLQESNQGHTDFQSVALPSELRYPHQGRL